MEQGESLLTYNKHGESDKVDALRVGGTGLCTVCHPVQLERRHFDPSLPLYLALTDQNLRKRVRSLRVHI